MHKNKPYKFKINITDQTQFLKIMQWLPEYCGAYQHTWDFIHNNYYGWPKMVEFLFLRQTDRDIFAMTWHTAVT